MEEIHWCYTDIPPIYSGVYPSQLIIQAVEVPSTYYDCLFYGSSFLNRIYLNCRLLSSLSVSCHSSFHSFLNTTNHLQTLIITHESINKWYCFFLVCALFDHSFLIFSFFLIFIKFAAPFCDFTRPPVCSLFPVNLCWIELLHHHPCLIFLWFLLCF